MGDSKKLHPLQKLLQPIVFCPEDWNAFTLSRVLTWKWDQKGSVLVLQSVIISFLTCYSSVTCVYILQIVKVYINDHTIIMHVWILWSPWNIAPASCLYFRWDPPPLRPKCLWKCPLISCALAKEPFDIKNHNQNITRLSLQVSESELKLKVTTGQGGEALLLSSDRVGLCNMNSVNTQCYVITLILWDTDGEKTCVKWDVSWRPSDLGFI